MTDIAITCRWQGHESQLVLEEGKLVHDDDVQQRRIQIGSSDHCDFQIQDPRMPPHHTQIFASGRDWYVEPLAESPATLVIRRGIADLVVDRCRLETGDTVVLGHQSSPLFEASIVSADAIRKTTQPDPQPRADTMADTPAEMCAECHEREAIIAQLQDVNLVARQKQELWRRREQHFESTVRALQELTKELHDQLAQRDVELRREREQGIVHRNTAKECSTQLSTVLCELQGTKTALEGNMIHVRTLELEIDELKAHATNLAMHNEKLAKALAAFGTVSTNANG